MSSTVAVAIHELLAEGELGATTPLHTHVLQHLEDHVAVLVEVEQRQGGHLGGGAAGAALGRLRGDPGVGRLVLQRHAALPGTVVGLDVRRGDNPLPAELGEADGEGVAATAVLRGVLRARQGVAPSVASLGVAGHLDVQRGLLWDTQRHTCRHPY